MLLMQWAENCNNAYWPSLKYDNCYVRHCCNDHPIILNLFFVYNYIWLLPIWDCFMCYDVIEYLKHNICQLHSSKMLKLTLTSIIKCYQETFPKTNIIIANWTMPIYYFTTTGYSSLNADLTCLDFTNINHMIK